MVAKSSPNMWTAVSGRQSSPPVKASGIRLPKHRLEPVGEMTHEQQGRGAKCREPERLRVPRARIVTEHVEDGVGPRCHAEGEGHTGVLQSSLRTSESV